MNKLLLSLLSMICAVGASDVKLDLTDAAVRATKRFDQEFRGQFKPEGDAWRLDYTFPMLTYGYGEREVEQQITVALTGAAKQAETFKLELYNDTDTKHAFIMRLVGSDGTVWDSPPVVMSGEKQWRKLEFGKDEFINFSGKSPVVPAGELKSLILVVQQAITPKLASLGVYRKGMVKFRSPAVSTESGEVKPIFFEGKMYPKAQNMEIPAKENIPLNWTVQGSSKSYPMRSGIPFAEGKLYHAENARLLADGKAIPFSRKVLSRWNDGSIKSLLIKASAGFNSQYTLEYGSSVKVHESGVKFARQSGNEITVDTGSVQAVFRRDSPALLDLLKIDKREITNFTTGFNEPEYVISDKQCSLESSDALEAVVAVTGNYRSLKDNSTPFQFKARFYFMKGCRSVRLTFTYFNGSTENYNPLPDISLSAELPEAVANWSLGQQKGNFAGKNVSLKLDGAVYTGDQRQIRATIGSAAYDRFEGIYELGNIGIGMVDAWQNHPKLIELAPNCFKIMLSSKESSLNDGKNVRSKFIAGMAKTHQLIIGADDRETVGDYLKQPLLSASPEYICGTGAFGNIMPVDRRKFGLFENACDWWLNDTQVTGRYFGDFYGLRDFGDWSANRPGSMWFNLETGGGMALLIQFVRSGKQQYLDFARQANYHYIDIDTCYAENLDPKDPKRSYGAVSAHCPDHVADDKTGKRKLSYLHIGGHDWYPEVSWFYQLTGDERLYDAAMIHAEATIYSIDHHFKPNHVLAREYAWPLKNLMVFYEINQDPRYLQAAAKVMNFFTFWREGFGSGRLGNTLGQPGVCLEAIAFYHRMTRDPQALVLLKKATDSLIAATYFDPESGLPADSLYNEDSRLMFLNALTYCYRQLGEADYIRKFVPYTYFHLRHPDQLVDSTALWCVPEFIKAMAELGIAEPFKKPSMVALHGFSPEKDNIRQAELKVVKHPGREQLISISRIAIQRLGQFSRGLVVGDWQGYPRDTKNILKTSAPELEGDEFGRIQILDPQGREYLNDHLRNYHCVVRDFRIPADAAPGIYTVKIVISDKVCLGILASASEPGLALVSTDGFPWMPRVYLPVNHDRQFSITVKERRPATPGGARIHAPNGSFREFFNNPNLDYAPEIYRLNQGRGIWFIERSMLNRLSLMNIDGTPPWLCPSEEDACEFMKQQLN